MQRGPVKSRLTASLVVLFVAIEMGAFEMVAPGMVATAHADPYPNCDRTPSSADVDAAKGMHKAAEAYYARARYDKAITSWKEAYTFDCTAHRLLINIGNAYEKLGRTQEAIEAFETYVARMGSNADSTIVEKLSNLRELLANAPPDPVPDPNPVPNPVPQPPPEQAPGNGDDGEGPGAAPWVMVGVGAGVAVAGGVMLGIGVKKESDAAAVCEDRGANEPCPPDIAEDGNLGIKMQIAGGVLLGVGLAAAAGGVIWWAVANIPEGPTATGWTIGPLEKVQPTVGAWPGYGTLGISGAF